MKIYNNIFKKIISLENLFLAWEKFRKGKGGKPDVQRFEFNLEQNIFRLHRSLSNKKYEHGEYANFYIRDPKLRHIHKATVCDRIVHHAVFRAVNAVFEPAFISRSFSCRVGKGTHKGVDALASMARKASRNNSGPCFALKCDIRKFFESVDHGILLGILRRKIKDRDAMWLLEEIVGSFISRRSDLFSRKGLPIGNLTSQLFANIYMNEFDQFAKHRLKLENYVRYTDDFVVVAEDRPYLESLVPAIRSFLSERLALELHPGKVGIRKFGQGIDFLGYVVLPHHRALRTKTKRRMFRKLEQMAKGCRDGTVSEQAFRQSLQSYLGVLSHADARGLSDKLKNQFWFWLTDSPRL